jgi:CheY-like chemotaxis protein
MPNLKDNHHVTILIAEDDDGHAELIQELFRDVGIRNPTQRFRDGQEVIDFLAARLAHPDPCNGSYLLLLDIRMPRMDGVDVLRRMKADPRLKAIPVVMLTTTDDPREIQGCYELGCNNYITKPVEFGQFTTALRQLGLFLLIMQFPCMPKATV